MCKKLIMMLLVTVLDVVFCQNAFHFVAVVMASPINVLAMLCHLL